MVKLKTDGSNETNETDYNILELFVLNQILTENVLGWKKSTVGYMFMVEFGEILPWMIFGF